jgi:hypothetical protein
MAEVTAAQLLKKLLAIYRTRKFNTVLTETHHQNIICDIQILFTPRNLISIGSHLHLELPNRLFLSGFPTEIM